MPTSIYRISERQNQIVKKGLYTYSTVLLAYQQQQYSCTIGTLVQLERLESDCLQTYTAGMYPINVCMVSPLMGILHATACLEYMLSSKDYSIMQSHIDHAKLPGHTCNPATSISKQMTPNNIRSKERNKKYILFSTIPGNLY